MTNHDQLPTAIPELSPEEQATFSPARLNEWRGTQYSILGNLGAANNFSNENYKEDFKASIDDTLNKFLEQNGVTFESSNYDEIRTLFREASIDKISEDEWGNSPASRGLDPDDHKSQSDIFRERIEQRVGAGNRSSDVDVRGELNDDVLAEAYLEDARFDVGRSREVWAIASAKRQGRAFSVKDASREKVKDAYHKSVQKLGIMELEDTIVDSESDTEKNVKVIAWLFDEQAKLRELTTEKLKSTKTSKFVEWMNKGSMLQRVGKSALVGVAASGAAAGISLVAGFGLMAGAAGGAVAGAVGFGRFVRGFARGDRQRGMTTANEEFGTDGRPVDEDGVEGNTIVERFEDVAKTYNTAFEEGTHDEQKKRRKAVYRGLTNAALGVGVGAAVHYISDFLSEAPSGSTDTGTGNGHRTPWADRDADGDGVPNGQDFAPHDPDVTIKPDSIDLHAVSHDARWVDPGEGWYQTFQELGIPQDHWSHVLESAGPKLHEQGLAYRMDDGQWGISEPGRLSDASLRVIARAARRDGFDLAA